jgi:hypothetical protein
MHDGVASRGLLLKHGSLRKRCALPGRWPRTTTVTTKYRAVHRNHGVDSTEELLS